MMASMRASLRARPEVEIGLRLEGVAQLHIDGARSFLVRAFPGGSRGFALPQHRACKTLLVKKDTLVSQDVLNEIKRQAERIVEAERFFSWVSNSCLTLGS